jgi:hypothetical protein
MRNFRWESLGGFLLESARIVAMTSVISAGAQFRDGIMVGILPDWEKIL